MPSQNVALYALNRGEISRSALARVDNQRLRLSAEIQENFMPFVMGMATLRPGLAYVGGTKSNLRTKLLDFVYAIDDKALIELTDSVMRVRVDDTLITRPSVSTSVTNGDFSSATGWTLTAGSGAAASIGASTSFPTVAASNTSASTSSTGSHTVALPSGIQAGDLLLICLAAPIGNVFNTPSGWTALSSDANGSHVRLHTFYKTATGSEGSSVTVTSIGCKCAHTSFRITGHGGAPEVATAVTGNGTNANPGALTPSWGSLSSLWIAVMAAAAAPSISAAPSNYSDLLTSTTGGTTTDDARLGSARRSVSGSSENPGAFTSASGQYVTITIGVKPLVSDLYLSAAAEGSSAFAERSVTVAGADVGVQHGLRIVVSRGPVEFQAGSSSGASDYISPTLLSTGTHSLALTPSDTSFYVRFTTRTKQTKIVDSISIDAAGAMELPTPWTEDDLSLVRWRQSGDVVFAVCEGRQHRRIERRAARSWSTVLYQSDNGPFISPGTQYNDIVMTLADTIGSNTTLTASRAYFRAEHVGMLIRITHAGQIFRTDLAAENAFTKPIRVSGVGTDNDFSVTRAGTWAGTLTMQRSYDGEDSGFIDTGMTYTSNGTTSFAPGTEFDNVVQWYRLGFKPSGYTSGVAEATLTYNGGSGSGIGRIVRYISSTQVEIEVLTRFVNSAASKDWQIGEWSTLAGWPTSNEFFDGRYWQFGKDRCWGSVTDDYANFDPDAEGDSAPIIRSIGFGPVARINWALALARLVVGRECAETSIRSSSFDEPITPTAFTMKDCSSQGAAMIPAVRVDKRGIFVQQSGRRLYELAFSVEQQDYIPRDLTRLNLDIGIDGFATLAVQRQPDTHVRAPRLDGQLVNLLYEPGEEAEAFWRVVTDGEIEDVAVLPGAVEDTVYLVVKRTINGSDVRYIEKFARYDQCKGQPEARLADSHVIYSGAATTAITGLSHLEGKTVVVWGWNTSTPFTVTLPDGTTATVGRDMGTFTVSGGQITGLPAAVTDACVGLGYTGKFKSAKLAYAAANGTAINQIKRITHLGSILIDTHYQGLEHGPNFDRMDNLPLVEKGNTTAEHTVWPDLDMSMMEHPGQYDTDTRLCLRATAPKPCTVLGVTIGIETNDKLT